MRVLIQLVDGADVFIEACDGETTLACALHRRAEGSTLRRLELSCPLVEPPAPWEQARRPALLPRLERYFEALNDGRFADAAQCFSTDCLYVHPPYRGGEPPAVFRGRAALVAEWPSRRGRRRVETRIERCVQDGNHAFVEGLAAGGTFLSSVVLDRDGLINRYVAFHTQDRVPRPAEGALAA